MVGLRKTNRRLLREAVRYGQALAAWNCRFEGARGGMYERSRAEFAEEVEEFKQGGCWTRRRIRWRKKMKREFVGYVRLAWARRRQRVKLSGNSRGPEYPGGGKYRKGGVALAGGVSRASLDGSTAHLATNLVHAAAIATPKTAEAPSIGISVLAGLQELMENRAKGQLTCFVGVGCSVCDPCF